MGRIFGATVWLISLSSAIAAEPRWSYVQSGDFAIFSSANEGETRRVLDHFERVRSFFAATTAAGVRQRDEPIRVIVFGSKKEYDQYRPNEFATAFYTQTGGHDYIVLGGAGDDVFPIAVHEYVHLVARHAGLNLPPWLNEGIAELYSTLKPVGDKVVVGNIIPGRLAEMTQQKWVPLATILAATSDSPYYNEKNRAGSLYNEGWALTHMLQLSPQYSPHFRELLLQIANGKPSQAVVEGIYGKPLGVVESDLQSYIRRDSFSGGIFSAKLSGGPKAAIEPADIFDVKFALIDLSNRPDKETEIRRKLNDLANEYPKKPEPQSALGYLAWREGKQEEARKSFAAAFDLGGRNPQMLWDYGRLAGSSDSAGAIRALNALLEDQPGRMDARFVLARIQLSANHPGDALETLALVKSVRPADAPRLFELLAYAKVETKGVEAARADAERWLANAKDDNDRERANRFIQSLTQPAAVQPVLTKSEDLVAAEPQSATKPAWISIRGDFDEVDCSGPIRKIVVKTSGGRVALLVDEPDKIAISGLGATTMDLYCGPQKSAPVRVQYDPAVDSGAGAQGGVRSIRFEAVTR